MCSITEHNRQQLTYADDARSAGGRAIPSNERKTSLKQLGTTLNFIYCWLKHFQQNYQGILEMNLEAMIELFKKNQL